jgi:hypothetical protein
MKDEELLKLASHFLAIHPIDENKPENLLKFALAIRKETIEEVLTSLKDVPNPEANKTAINRIMSMNYD